MGCVLACLGAGCRAEQPTATPPAPSAEVVVPVRPSLTDDEVATMAHVEAHFRALPETSPRDAAHPWELAGAADYLANELEGMGITIERIGHEQDGVLLIDILATLPGGSRGDEVLMVGTHYDSPAGSAGSASAGNVALLLELARGLRGARFERTVRLAFFALGEGSDGRGPHRSSRRFLESRELDEARFVGFVGLETSRMLQQRSVQIPLGCAVGPDAAGLAAALIEATSGAPFVWREGTLAVTDESDGGAFAARGFRALDLRPGWSLDAEETARLAHRLRFGISRLAGEVWNGAGTFTPLLPAK